jgi:3-oxoacyl-(acyl-carrier-protein) synthase
MNAAENIFVHGLGAVSPAGWSVSALRDALARGEPIAATDVMRPGWDRPLRVRKVPVPVPRPQFLAHGRLRRASPISHYAVSAALEALGNEATGGSDPRLTLGIVYCAMSGCVNYSGRFYGEVLKDPATASPLIFPETVYNSPASHLAAVLGTTSAHYTIVGDPGTFLQGIALAADWLAGGRVESCLVIGAEESDWLTADAMRMFAHSATVSEGAGALYLRNTPATGSAVRLQAITGSHLFGKCSRAQAARLTREELTGGRNDLLCDGLSGSSTADRDEQSAWHDWPGPRLSLKKILGEGLMAAAAWQCVAAVDALQQRQHETATVSVVGCNQQAIAAQFARGE